MSIQIKDYIQKKILKDSVELEDDTPLYSSGLINSMGHLKLINFIERTFNIAVPMNEVGIDTFDNVQRIEGFLNSKMKSYE